MLNPVLNSTGRHITREALGLYVLGDLTVRDTIAAEQHLSSCPRCKNSLHKVAAVIAALRAPLFGPGYAASR